MSEEEIDFFSSSSTVMISSFFIEKRNKVIKNDEVSPVLATEAKNFVINTRQVICQFLYVKFLLYDYIISQDFQEAERKRALSEANQVPEPQRHGKDSSFNNKSTTNNSNNSSSSLFNSISSNAISASNLRPLFVPAILREKFASLAERNTDRNIETCGVLCGKMSNNQFTVTVVVLPKQSGTSDSCLTSHEEELFEVLEKHDVITLGWIHTHPSQSAFLSSVDLHTHFSYQSMLPESIAIVYAPRYQQYQSFSITPPGLAVLGECKQTGFHYHAKEPPLEMVSPHVQMDATLGLTTVDLRL
ncbi:STAM-binding protein-like A [Convolutriloba macropyga]|uniref:STAM-binding protein-like A n=1 Tax=Convolutriloba macropyga TaxID=536237 RepID=UPI003F51B91D